MLNVIMLSVAFYLLLSWMSLFWVSRFIYCYAECCYAECHYAEYHLNVASLYETLSGINIGEVTAHETAIGSQGKKYSGVATLTSKEKILLALSSQGTSFCEKILQMWMTLQRLNVHFTDFNLKWYKSINFFRS